MASMLAAQPSQPDAAGDWPMYSRDLAGTRYAPLTHVNTQNVARLVRAWFYRLPERAPKK
jgi:quinoprotein glucose dehydrogenase